MSNQSTLRAFDLAHLAHLELLTPKPEESLNFFVNVMFLPESREPAIAAGFRGDVGADVVGTVAPLVGLVGARDLVAR